MMALLTRWVRRNLFRKSFDVALSVVVIPSTAWALYTLVCWALFVANWGVLVGSLRVLMVGIYPPDQLWRAWGSVALIAAIFGSGLGLTIAPTVRVIACLLALGLLVASGTGMGSAALAFAS
jgi:general L-amino acid transport system permease protein